MENFIKKNQNALILLIAIFSAGATYQSTLVSLAPDLAFSWIFSLHYFFIHGLEHGKDVIFPYGPYGFLFFSVPMQTLPLTNFFHIIVSVLYSWASLFLFIKSKENQKHAIAIGFLVVYVLGMVTNITNIMMFLPLLFILLRETTKQKRYFFLACAIAAFGLLTKIGFGMLGAFVIFSYSLYKIFENIKPTDNKKILITNDANGMNIVAEVSIGAAIYFATLIGFWLILYKNLSSLPDFIMWTKEVSLGYAQSMVFCHIKNYYLLAFGILLYLIAPFLLKNKDLKIYHIVTLLMTVFYVKYTMVRHISYIEPYFLIYILIYMCFMKKFSKTAIIYLLCLYGLFFWFKAESSIFTQSKDYLKSLSQPRGLAYVKEEIYNFDKNYELNYDLTVLRNGMLELPKKQKNLLGNSTVEVFPWEQMFVYANNLNWKPRFAFHSYMENTEKLDGKGAEFFQRKDAPEFVFWHKPLFDFDQEYGRRGVMSIDRRYIFNEDPQTLYQILNQYEPVDNNNFAVIFKKSLKPNLPIRKEYPAKNIVINEWTNVKDTEGNITLLKLYPERTFLGMIMSLIGPDVFSYIDYKFYDDSVIRYKFPLVSTVKHGVWIAPHVYELNMPFEAKKVKQIRIAVDFPYTLEKTIPATWVIIPYKKSKLAFDFDTDNLINKQFLPNKNSFKYYDLSYEEKELSNETKKKELVSKKTIKLYKNKKYILSLKFTANIDNVYYPRNFPCTLNADGDNILQNHTLLLLNDNTEQSAILRYIPKRDTELENIRIHCLNKNNHFNFKEAKLYEL